jgi:hypothetical protein
MIAQYVLREFKLSRISSGSSFERHASRVGGVEHLRRPHRAYGLLRANCQHFSRLVIRKMKEHGWQQERRLGEPFKPDDFSALLANPGKANTWRIEKPSGTNWDTLVQLDRETGLLMAIDDGTTFAPTQSWQRHQNGIQAGLSLFGVAPERRCRPM